MLSEKVRVAALPKYGNDYCRTIIAVELIEEGEPVWWYEPHNNEEERFYSWHEIEQHDDLETSEKLKVYSYMVGIDTYASTVDPESDPSWFFNHHCDGNCHYNGDRQVVARRRIFPGEEVHYDYALTETEASFHAGMHCKCGAATCRGILRFDDYRHTEFWSKFKGHTTRHIAARAAECGWLDSRLHVRRISLPPRSDEQRGVFALSFVRRGDVVAVFGGKTLGIKEASLLEQSHPGYPYLLQVDSELWQVPHRSDSPDSPDFINHSCHANCGMLDSTQVIALRDIKAGEQITIDYAVCNDGSSKWESDNFACGCGSRTCRRKVSSKDWQNADVQDKYWPYFSPFVRRLVAKRRPDLAKGGITSPSVARALPAVEMDVMSSDLSAKKAAGSGSASASPVLRIAVVSA